MSAEKKFGELWNLEGMQEIDKKNVKRATELINEYDLSFDNALKVIRASNIEMVAEMMGELYEPINEIKDNIKRIRQSLPEN
jgi:hypothetical protein